jgi:hypothetical protein
VIKFAGLDHYQLMLDIHPSAIAARLDAVPALGAATVAQQWPGTVRIHVVERIPVVVVASGPGRWAEVDVTGRVIALVTGTTPALPELSGAGAPPALGAWWPGSPGPWARPGAGVAGVDMVAASDSPNVPSGVTAALAAVTAVPQGVRPEVLSVSIAASGGISMTVLPPSSTAGPITVDFGDGSQLARKLSALAALLTQADLAGVRSIDLTVPDRPAALTAR